MTISESTTQFYEQLACEARASGDFDRANSLSSCAEFFRDNRAWPCVPSHEADLPEVAR